MTVASSVFLSIGFATLHGVCAEFLGRACKRSVNVTTTLIEIVYLILLLPLGRENVVVVVAGTDNFARNFGLNLQCTIYLDIQST